VTTFDAKSVDTSQIPQPALEYLRNPSSLAPTTVEVQGQTWNLINAVEQIIHETDLSPHSPIDQLQIDVAPVHVMLRSISSTDLTFGQGRVVRYAEVNLFIWQIGKMG
jgi:hypothetical protein